MPTVAEGVLTFRFPGGFYIPGAPQMLDGQHRNPQRTIPSDSSGTNRRAW